MLPANHPQRLALNDEVHARPPEALIAPLRLSYLVLMPSNGREGERGALANLLARFRVQPPGEDQNHFTADLGAFRLRWERHTEFARYTFIVPGAEPKPFARPATGAVPLDWIAGIPGRTMVATHAVLLPKARGELRPEKISTDFFAGNPLIGSRISGGLGMALTDWRIHRDGFGRLLVYDRGMTLRQSGRLMQRLLEIDTYRIMALLALPVARELTPFLGQCERDLVEITSRMQQAGEEDEPRLLDRLTRLEAEIEGRHSDTLYRFSAATAYYDLVEQRIEELREQRIEGLQTFQEFNDRRLAPAMATCRSVFDRQAALSERVARATVLLNTRVDVTRERQNQALLKSMDRRANLQLRLQQTVEGLSVAAITYYIVGLAGYAAKAAKAAGWNVDPDIASGIAIPIVAALVWLGLLRFRKSLHRETDGSHPLRN
jgi:uncharacterized membrane-anchored protein